MKHRSTLLVLISLVLAFFLPLHSLAQAAPDTTQFAAPNQKADFYLTIGGGTLPFTYQWYKNGVAITGATASTYQIASYTDAAAGTYYVVVSNAAGSSTSNKVTLSTLVPPGPVTLGVKTTTATGTTTQATTTPTN